MDKLISHNQSAFLKGRLLVDGMVVVNELMDLVNRSKKLYLLFKVDFEKAYDYVSWFFLDYMLSRFEFNDRWRSWIKACIFSDNLTVLINGFSNQEISIQKG